MGEHLAHQGDLAVEPAVVHHQLADVLEDELEHALEGVAQGVLVFGGPFEAGAQLVETLLQRVGRQAERLLAQGDGQLAGFGGEIGVGGAGLAGDAVEQAGQHLGKGRCGRIGAIDGAEAGKIADRAGGSSSSALRLHARSRPWSLSARRSGLVPEALSTRSSISRLRA